MNSASLFDIGVLIPDLLLPENADARKWACIACDQYTSRPEIWDAIDAEVGAAPSTLRLILPETQLPDAPVRVPEIQKTMEAYARDVLTRRLHGFVLTARTTPAGCRKGLMLAVDLEQYDYSAGSASRIRATEGTILSRIPPRMQVRRGALLESPHIMLLADDKARTLIEPLYEKLHARAPLYDTELMLDWGHLTGWAVTDPDDLAAAERALLALDQARGDAPLFAVGDGNHSLATAKAVWEELKLSLTPEQRETHPARWALCEVVNLYDESLRFEPIHRLLRGEGLDAVWRRAAERGVQLDGGDVRQVQPFLDETLDPSVQVDYIHGDKETVALGQKPGQLGLLLQVVGKHELFALVSRYGALPRKSFSMGEADEKRCYLEAKSIVL